MKQPMFGTLQRKHAVELRKLDTRFDPLYRERQIKLLDEYLASCGMNYYEESTFGLLKDLTEYAPTLERCLPNEFPECVNKTYRIMFNAFDEFITDLIGDHYELQGWNGPEGEVEWCEDHFEKEEALKAYDEALEEGCKYVMLRKVDKEGMPIDENIVACNF